MTPGRLCDLMQYWIMNGRTDVERAQFEVPPPGYRGSLRGTVWDPDAMLSGYGG